MQFTLITGATSGIGLELAKVFALNGHDLILHGRTGKKLDPVVLRLKENYPDIKIKSIAIDLLKKNASEEIFKYTRENKLKVDILVNNAGFGDFGEFHKSDLKKQEDMLRVNIEVLTKLSHLFSKNMVKRKRGKILNLASVAAFLPGPLMSVYYASKAYVLHFSEALAVELHPYGVQVTAVCPGATKSNFQKTANLTHSKLVSFGGLPSARDVAEFSYLELKRGNVVSIHGFKNKLMIFPRKFLPRNWITKMVMNSQSGEKK